MLRSKLGEVLLLGPIFIDASLLLHLGCPLLTETNLLIEALTIQCSALLLSLSSLPLYRGGEVCGRCRRSRSRDWRRWVRHPCRRRLLSALALYRAW